MATFWGVDSLTPIDHVIDAKHNKTLFDVVCEHCDRVPAFWGRYLNGHDHRKKVKNKIVGANLNLTAKEAAYVFQASKGVTRILPIYVPVKASVGSTKQQGLIDAGRAIAAADNLQIPNGVFLWADIEPEWTTSPEWLRGWWERMFTSRFGGCGGIYEDPRETNGSSFAWAYADAIQQTEDMSPTSSASQAEQASTLGGAVYEFFNPQPPSTAIQEQFSKKMKPWQQANFKKGLRDHPIPQAEMPALRHYLWSQRPTHANIKDLKSTPAYAPVRPYRVSDSTMIWQYAIDCLHLGGGKNGLIDMNVATEQGLETMWKI